MCGFLFYTPALTLTAHQYYSEANDRRTYPIINKTTIIHTNNSSY